MRVPPVIAPREPPPAAPGELEEDLRVSRTATSTDLAPATRVSEPAEGWDAIAALIESTKPGITRMVTITALVGLVLAALVVRPLEAAELAILVAGVGVGTWLTAGGANALNEWIERRADARMHRTAGRPLPREAVRPGQVLAFAAAINVAGLAVLLAVGGPIPALVSLACIITYVAMYTPLKPLTPLSTLVGAIPGALPPLIGWTAVAGPGDAASLLGAGGLALFALMFVWQLPHFLAIAWMYAGDYERGGFRVLPVIDPARTATSVCILATAILLIPATLAPWWAMAPHVGPAYGLVALSTGLGYVWLAVRLVRRRTREAARTVFFASIIHLPVLMVVLVADAWL